MQYHLFMIVLAEYSSSYSLFACHMRLATSILTLLKLSNISKPLCSSLTLAPQCRIHLVFTWFFWVIWRWFVRTCMYLLHLRPWLHVRVLPFRGVESCIAALNVYRWLIKCFLWTCWFAGSIFGREVCRLYRQKYQDKIHSLSPSSSLLQEIQVCTYVGHAEYVRTLYV